MFYFVTGKNPFCHADDFDSLRLLVFAWLTISTDNIFINYSLNFNLY